MGYSVDVELYDLNAAPERGRGHSKDYHRRGYHHLPGQNGEKRPNPAGRRRTFLSRAREIPLSLTRTRGRLPSRIPRAGSTRLGSRPTGRNPGRPGPGRPPGGIRANPDPAAQPPHREESGSAWALLLIRPDPPGGIRANPDPAVQPPRREASGSAWPLLSIRPTGRPPPGPADPRRPIAGHIAAREVVR